MVRTRMEEAPVGIKVLKGFKGTGPGLPVFGVAGGEVAEQHPVNTHPIPGNGPGRWPRIF
jgi:hypothetical protein